MRSPKQATVIENTIIVEIAVMVMVIDQSA